MATDAVKSAIILSILQDKDFDMQAPRMKIARECAQKVLDTISSENMSECQRCVYICHEAQQKVRSSGNSIQLQAVEYLEAAFVERLSLCSNI